MKLKTVQVSTAYPFNFFQASLSKAIDGSCLVYPRAVPGPLISDGSLFDTNNEGDSGGQGVDDFQGLAAYQRGDPLQHISWKSFSRGQGLHTKKFEGQRGRVFLFNLESLAGRDMEQKLARICHMVIEADTQSLSYGLQLGSTLIPPRFGASHRRECLRALALFRHEG